MMRPVMLTRITLAFCLAACMVLALPFLFSARAEAAASENSKAEHYDWQGVIDGKIPVSVWFETRDSLIVGEIVYTKTREKRPIRLLGTISQGQLCMNEMINGLVTGMITGTIKDGGFEGIWAMPGKIKEKDGGFEFIEGKELSIRLVAAPDQSKPFGWKYDPNAFAGRYFYSYGKNARGGVVEVTRAKDGSIEFRIDSNIGAPSFNLASFPSIQPDAEEESKATGQLRGNRMLCEINEDCAFEMLFFNDFLVIRYLDGKNCEGWFGARASIEGHFMKLGK